MQTKKEENFVHLFHVLLPTYNSINGLQPLWWSGQKEIFVVYLITSYPSFVHTRDHCSPIFSFAARKNR